MTLMVTPLLYLAVMKKWAKKQSGFTIVELLIVVVVIAILAAITIVAYNGIQNRAKQSAAQSTVSQANRKVLLYATQNADQYPPDLTTAGVTDTTGLEYTYNNSASPRTYGITATNGNFSYYISSTSQKPTIGGYPGHSQGGVAAITNLAINPSGEVDATGIVPSLATITNDTSWASSGNASFRITPTNSTGSDSFINLGGDQGGLRMGLQAGKTYTVSATIRLNAPLTGAIRAQARTLIVYYTSDAGSISAQTSAQAPNTASVTRLTRTFSIPATATAAWVRLYNGTTLGGGDVWWDSIMVTEGTTDYPYADGTSTNWAWTGTPHASTSNGPPVQ